MIPNDDPRCRCLLGHDFGDGYMRITYDWELGDSRGIVRLSIHMECPLHAKEYLGVTPRMGSLLP